MADEAFALSPISARATQPGEADYEAISAAFMETSRGRWFLTEYAKRNRNADTRMVLDAVARIEENLAAQKNVADDRLAEALQAIGSAVDEARAAAAVLAGQQAEQSLAPIRGAARILRETLMRLREIGADGRIYELMDSQVSAIEAACGEFQSSDAGNALTSAFDLLDQRISEFGGATKPPAPAAETHPARSSETLPDTAASPAESFMPPAQPEALPAAEAAQDDAVLDVIALEMAAPDFLGGNADAVCAAEPEPVEPEIEPPGESLELHQPSLGASLLARGIVRNAETSAADPLAPIRRMSQADKIALFS
jgi:hypothetical protein